LGEAFGARFPSSDMGNRFFRNTIEGPNGFKFGQTKINLSKGKCDFNNETQGIYCTWKIVEFPTLKDENLRFITEFEMKLIVPILPERLII